MLQPLEVELRQQLVAWMQQPLMTLERLVVEVRQQLVAWMHPPLERQPPVELHRAPAAVSVTVQTAVTTPRGC